MNYNLEGFGNTFSQHQQTRANNVGTLNGRGMFLVSNPFKQVVWVQRSFSDRKVATYHCSYWLWGHFSSETKQQASTYDVYCIRSVYLSSLILKFPSYLGNLTRKLVEARMTKEIWFKHSFSAYSHIVDAGMNQNGQFNKNWRMTFYYCKREGRKTDFRQKFKTHY